MTARNFRSFLCRGAYTQRSERQKFFQYGTESARDMSERNGKRYGASVPKPRGHSASLTAVKVTAKTAVRTVPNPATVARQAFVRNATESSKVLCAAFVFVQGGVRRMRNARMSQKSDHNRVNLLSATTFTLWDHFTLKWTASNQFNHFRSSTAIKFGRCELMRRSRSEVIFSSDCAIFGRVRDEKGSFFARDQSTVTELSKCTRLRSIFV